MIRHLRCGLNLALLVVAGGGLSLVGCSSAKVQPAAASDGQLPKAVVCDKCKVTYTKVPVRGAPVPRIVGYQSVKGMECPDCRSAVENFFSTGKLQHTCATCGSSMEICDAH